MSNGPASQESLSAQSSALTLAQCSFFAVNGKVRICHATGSSKNPYSVVNVSVNACNGHQGHPGDYVTTMQDDCSGRGCYPEGAPVDGSIRCCEGLVSKDGVCATPDPCANVNCAEGTSCNPETGGCDFICNAGEGWIAGGTIEGNLVVPTGGECRINGVNVKGDTVVNGYMMTIGSTFDGTVTVDGGSLVVQNWGSHFKKDLTMKHLSGLSGFWLEQSEAWMPGAIIEHDFTYEDNTFALHIQISRNSNQEGTAFVEVKNDLNYRNSPCPPPSQVTVGGTIKSTCP